MFLGFSTKLWWFSYFLTMKPVVFDLSLHPCKMTVSWTEGSEVHSPWVRMLALKSEEP